MLLRHLVGLFALAHAKECSFSVELLQLQDASGSFQEHVTKMRNITMDLVQALSGKYETFQIGLAGFVDKPIPFRGIGPFGANTYASDWCYQLFSPMTHDALAMQAALADLEWNMGVGGDSPENPLEALIFGALDQTVGWSDPYAEQKRSVVRIILLVTDDRAHQPTEADDGTARGWNWPRSYPNGPTGTSQGGFGAHSFVTSQLFANKEKYTRMADLFRLFDNNLTMTESEVEELLGLIEYFGPFPWPKIQPHPGDNSQPACETTEYPSIEQTARVLQDRNALPIFLVPEGDEGLLNYYTDMAEQLGVMSVVAPMDLDSIFENIVDAVTTLTQAVCEAPSTTKRPRPSTTTSTSHPILTNPPVVVPTRAPSTEAPTEMQPSTTSEMRLSTLPWAPSSAYTAAPSPSPTVLPLWTTRAAITEVITTSPPGATNALLTASGEILPFSTAAPNEAYDTSTTSELAFEASSAPTEADPSSSTSTANYQAIRNTTTSTPVSGNPFPSLSETETEADAGAATGVIIGATTGAIIGVGAVAGGVYAALGSHFMSTPQVPENIDTSIGDAPAHTVERERLEQVTMDMFQ